MATRPSGPNIDFRGRRRRRRRRLTRTIAIASVVAIGAGGYYVLSRGGRLPSPFSQESERPEFLFNFSTVKGYQLGPKKPSTRAAERAARDIRRGLSEFYIDAFLAPQSWRDGVPEDAWKIFAPAARKHAQRHSSSFTLGNVGRSVRSVSVTRKMLTVRVLFDSSGRPHAATAVAVFKARGTIRGGQRFEVSNRSALVLRPDSDRWLIVGYPKVATSVEPVKAGGGSPSPEGTP